MTAPVPAKNGTTLALEWSSSAIGIVGAFIIAARVSVSPWAFVFFLGSQLLLIGFSVRMRHYGLLVQQSAYVLSDILGLIRWFGL